MKVFISSVMQGFEEFRDAARDAIKECGHDVVMAEDFPSSPEDSRTACLAGVRNSDLLMLLAGTRYGSETQAGIAPTVEEYWEARLSAKPVLVFVQDIEGCNREKALTEFLSRIGRWESGHHRSSFSSTDGLKSAVKHALSQDLSSAIDRTMSATSEGIHDWLVALRAATYSHLETNSTVLPILGTIERPELTKVLQAAEENQSILVKGDAGVGKTGLINALVNHLMGEHLPVLFLRANAYPSASVSVSVVSEMLPVGTPLPQLIQLVSQIIGKVYIVVDQLDSVGGTAWSTTLCTFLKQMSVLPDVMVIATSRTYDAEAWPEIRDLGFQSFILKPLDVEIANSFLLALGITDPQADLVELARNLLNLSLIADLISHGEPVSDIHTQTGLWHLYRLSLANREGPQVLARAVELAKNNIQSGEMNFALDIAPDEPTRKLLSRNVLLPSSAERYRFFHEEIPSYFYAWDSALRRRLLPEFVLGEVAEHQLAPVLRWMHRMHHEDIGDAEAQFVTSLLREENLFSFFVRVSALDILKTQSDPRPEVCDVLSDFLASETYSQYFYDNLDNPAWVQPLEKSGIFDQFPQPIIKADGSVNAPRWFPGEYLIRVAPSCPELIVNLAKRADTENWTVHLNLVEAAKHVPPEQATEVAQEAVKWLQDNPYGTVFLAHKCIEFAAHLARQGQLDGLAILLGALLEVVQRPVPEEFKDNPYVKPRAEFRYDAFELEDLLTRSLKDYYVLGPAAILGVLEPELEAAIGFEELTSTDCSFIWLPRIDHPDPNSRDCKTVLSIGIRDLLNTWSSLEPQALEPTLANYVKSSNSIFRRLALGVVTSYLDTYQHLADDWVNDRNLFDDMEVEREFGELIRKLFPVLPAEARTKILGWILDGPQLVAEETLTTEQFNQEKESWVLQWLHPIKDFLTPEQQTLLDELTDRWGEPEPPGVFSAPKILVGDKSPYSVQQLVDMDDATLIAALKESLPEGGLDEPSLGGLGQALKQAANTLPEQYAKLLPRLLSEGVSDILMGDLINGLEDAWKQGREFDWEPILQYCDRKLKSTERTPYTGWNHTTGLYRRMAGLLHVGMRNDEHAVSPDLMARARAILLTLADDPDPTVEGEQITVSEDNFGPANLALNCVRGQALMALIGGYSLRKARLESATVPVEKPGAKRLDPIVQEFLTLKLDKENELSLAVHSIFGQYLPKLVWLDEDWVLGNLDLILPQGTPYWRAAWESYLMFSHHPSTRIYDILREHYKASVLSLDKPKSTQQAGDNVTNHILSLYLRGVEPLEGDDSLIELFFASAPASLRRHAVWFLWRVLDDDKPTAESELWGRLRKVWESRAAVAARSGDVEEFSTELSAFAWWLRCIPEDLPALYDLVECTVRFLGDDLHTRDVLEYLTNQAPQYPAFACRLLALAVEGASDIWQFRRNEQVRQVLQAGICSGEMEAKQIAREVVDLIGERGDYSYRDLLDL